MLAKCLQQINTARSPQPAVAECHGHGQGTQRIAQRTCWPLSIVSSITTMPPSILLSLART